MASSGNGAVGRVVALRYWRAADARVAVDAWKRSGEAVAEFARRHGIHPGRLRRWVAELDGRQEAVRFHPVRLVQRRNEDEGRRSEPIEIVTRDGHRVRVPAGFASDDLERVLMVLAVGAGC
jgi:transposase-like protein